MEGERRRNWAETDKRENNDMEKKSSLAVALSTINEDVMSAPILEENAPVGEAEEDVFTLFMELPTEMALKVLMFVDPEDLLKVAQTCPTLRSLSENDKLWDEKCKQEGFTFSLKSVDEELLGRRNTESSFKFSRLKTNFIKHLRIRANFCLNPIRKQVLHLGISKSFFPFEICVEFVADKIVFTTPTHPSVMKIFDPMSGEYLPFPGSLPFFVSTFHVEYPFIVTDSHDNSLKVWNAETREFLGKLQGHTGPVISLHIFKQILVSGSRDGEVRLCNIGEGTYLNALTGHLSDPPHLGAVTCVQYNGRLVASGSADKTVKIWNPNTAECLHTLTHPYGITTVKFSGDHVVSSCWDEVIRVWDLETGTCQYRLEGVKKMMALSQQGNVMKLEGNILVSGHPDMTVKVWDTRTWSCLNTLEGDNSHDGSVTAIDFNQHLVVTGSWDGKVKLWNIKTGRFERVLLVVEGSQVEEIRMEEALVVCAMQTVNKKTEIHVLNFGLH